MPPPLTAVMKKGQPQQQQQQVRQRPTSPTSAPPPPFTPPATRPAAPPAPPVHPPTPPRPPMPTRRSWLDKIVDYVVGGEPQHSFALICTKCRAHNGLMPQSEMQSYRMHPLFFPLLFIPSFLLKTYPMAAQPLL